MRMNLGDHLDSEGNGRSQNHEFAVVTYCFLAVFLALIAYFVYFMAFKSEDFINNPYNSARTEIFEQSVTRGSIYAADGTVLATTNTDSDGNETREYPYGRVFAHVVGYSTNGRMGVESMANFYLVRSSENFIAKAADDLTGVKSMGNGVVTTLNVDLQQAAYDALGAYDGAVVVMEPSTGKILAMVSKPDFDPNIIEDDWEWLTAEGGEGSSLLNRATQGLYPPGSTFKIVTTLAYIRQNEDYEDFTFSCGGSYTNGGQTIHCYGGEHHGTQTLKEAFANSCNSAYASIGVSLDADGFADTCDELLFNDELPTSFPYSESSFVLTAEDGVSSQMETAIGQGETLVTPLHMLLITSAIANDGVLMKPYVVDHTVSADMGLLEQFKPSEYGRLLTEDEAAVMQEYMSYVVEAGTGSKLSGADYDVAGKTGTAEYDSEGDSHSWFVGYAHRDGQEDIAIAVIVESSGTGSEYAVPVAKKVFDAYYGE